MDDAQVWSKRVEEWRASGMTAKEFCARHDLGLSALRYWTYRGRGTKKASEPKAMKLVPVTVKPRDERVSVAPSEAERSKPALTIELGRARIAVWAGFDPATLRAVLEVLGDHRTSGAQ
jgi:transposase